MLENAAQIQSPYVGGTRTRTGLTSEHPALLILDVYKAHRNESSLALMATLNIRVSFVPGGCTRELQPLPGYCNERYCEKRNEEKIHRHIFKRNSGSSGKVRGFRRCVCKF